jgi:16S rRNA (adenine1518-N6/adenine1519-N6)-dimethyltransferase
LRTNAFRPKKSFGQNFLHDPAIAQRIVDAAELCPGETVIELGPGKGILTRPLAEKEVRLIAVELDRELHRDLESYFRENEADVELLNADFTKLSITGILTSRGLESCVLFGNIPYHLTRDVLFSFLVDENEMIEAAYLMLQREVGERIVSAPGSRVYGITSVVLQSLYAVRSVLRIGPGAFYPRPKVESIVVEFDALKESPLDPGEIREFTALVKNLFQQRRKTIHNTLRRFYSLSDAQLVEIGRTAGVSLDKRPEELGKEAFLELSRAVSRATATG